MGMYRIIIVGGDKTVYFLTRHLRDAGHKVTIINRSEERCQELCRVTDATVVFGDGSTLESLEEAGARRADVVLALTPNDQDNLVACQIAQKVYDVPKTVALVNDPENEAIFQQLGINIALSKTRIITSVIEQQTSFTDITDLMPLAEGSVHVADVRLDRASPVVGKMLSEIDLGEDTLVAAIIRDGKMIVPRGSNQLHANDHVVVFSTTETHEHAMHVLTGE